MKRSRLSAWQFILLVLTAIYFLVPLYGTAEFSLETGPGTYGFDAYSKILQDPMFKDTFLLSLKLALITVVVSMVLMVPTVYWVNLKLPRLRRVMDFVAVLPFVVPPVTLAIGIAHLFQSWIWLLSGPQILVLAYVILALPFTYRSLDAGMRSIDVHTLTEAGQSLGANWLTVMLRIILPNLRTAIISAAFLTITLVMGEYTMASLLLFNTFPIYMNEIGNSEATPAAALAMISLILTWAALLGVLWIGRGRGTGRRTVQIGGAR